MSTLQTQVPSEMQALKTDYKLQALSPCYSRGLTTVFHFVSVLFKRALAQRRRRVDILFLLCNNKALSCICRWHGEQTDSNFWKCSWLIEPNYNAVLPEGPQFRHQDWFSTLSLHVQRFHQIFVICWWDLSLHNFASLRSVAVKCSSSLVLLIFQAFVFCPNSVLRCIAATKFKMI